MHCRNSISIRYQKPNPRNIISIVSYQPNQRQYNCCTCTGRFRPHPESQKALSALPKEQALVLDEHEERFQRVINTWNIHPCISIHGLQWCDTNINTSNISKSLRFKSNSCRQQDHLWSKRLFFFQAFQENQLWETRSWRKPSSCCESDFWIFYQRISFREI